MAFQMTNMVRYAIKGRWSNGRPVVNILDMSVQANANAPGGPFTSEIRYEWVAEKALDIADNWKDHILPTLTTAYQFEAVSWIDLNSANGSTGEVTPTGGGAAGALGADSSVPQNTLLISKIEGARSRGTRPGRWYLSGVPEAKFDNNGILDPIWVTQMDNKLEEFRQGVEDQGLTDDVWSVPVVIHEKSASAGEITKFSTSNKMGKQGRRYDGRA